MKKYSKPFMETILLSSLDVIQASGIETFIGDGAGETPSIWEEKLKNFNS